MWSVETPNPRLASIFGPTWSWSPIHALIVELCSDLLDEETLVLLGFNDGGGPTDQGKRTIKVLQGKDLRQLMSQNETHQFPQVIRG